MQETNMADMEALKQEDRIFPPPAEFVKNAAISGMDAYRAMCADAERDYEGFWAKLARENLEWRKPFTRTLDESNAPFYKWFDDGQLNVSYNCLDRKLPNGNADLFVFFFVVDDGLLIKVSYRVLFFLVCC